MPYVTSIERIGIKKGLEQGRLQMAHQSVVDVLEIRFGSVPDATKESIQEIANVDHASALLKAAIQTESLVAFERRLAVTRFDRD